MLETRKLVYNEKCTCHVYIVRLAENDSQSGVFSC